MKVCWKNEREHEIGGVKHGESKAKFQSNVGCAVVHLGLMVSWMLLVRIQIFFNFIRVCKGSQIEFPPEFG
jgi:hypothetical protein